MRKLWVGVAVATLVWTSRVGDARAQAATDPYLGMDGRILAGKTVWEYKNVPGVWEALRLTNGNTLLGGGDSKRVLEITPQGQIAWEVNSNDVPELGLTYIASVQVLKSGNLLVCNWLGHDGGTGVHGFEVTRDKKVVWKPNDHKLLKSVATIIALDE